MTSPNPIAVFIEDPTLQRLITEQLDAGKIIWRSTKRDEFPALLSALPPLCPVITMEGDIPHFLVPYKKNGTVLEVPRGSFRLGEILDKLRYLLSGRNTHLEDETSQISLGPFILYPAENLLVHQETSHEIRLTDKERLLLRVLNEAGQSGLPRRDLLKAVWGYADDTETHTLETHIYRLRQKLEPFAAHDMIRADDGVYLLDIKKPA